MAWWLLALGALLIIIGLYGKISEYKNIKEYIDFENLTTNKRYLKEDQPKEQKKKRVDNNNLLKQESSELKEDNLQNIRDKKDKLDKINKDLDQIISEIARKEDRIIDYIKRDKKNKSLSQKNTKAQRKNNEQVSLAENLQHNKKEEKEPRDALLNQEKEAEDVKSDFQEVLNQTSSTLEEEMALNKEEIPVKHQNVISQAKKGLEIEEIAEKLNIGIRETQLILKLYQGEADNNV